MSVASAAASAVHNTASEAMSSPGGLAGALGGTGAMGISAELIRRAQAKKAKARKGRAGFGGAIRQGVFGKVASAVGGDNGRLDTIEARIDALEGGTEGDVTQPSSTVNVPTSPEEGIGAAPALPEPTMASAEKMFGGGAIRQIAAGAGKFKK
jgi:hypothetical protein